MAAYLRHPSAPGTDAGPALEEASRRTWRRRLPILRKASQLLFLAPARLMLSSSKDLRRDHTRRLRVLGTPPTFRPAFSCFWAAAGVPAAALRGAGAGVVWAGELSPPRLECTCRAVHTGHK
jgi:hypothetical protein